MYEPLEYIASPEDWEIATEDVRPNPFTNFDGLEVRLALVRAPNYKAKSGPVVSGPESLVRILRSKLEAEVVESMLTVIMNVRNRVTGVYVAARGQEAGVTVEPLDILRPVIAAGASRFIVVHNHPSGEADPSSEDVAITKRLNQAASCLNMTMFDHVILAQDSYVSFADRGML